MLRSRSLLIFLIFSSAGFGQVASGGAFQLEKTALTGGGDVLSSTGCTPVPDQSCITVTSTVGQSVAGWRSGGISTSKTYNVVSGFWQDPAFAPTAAQVSASGRVLDPLSRAVSQATVIFTSTGGVSRTAITNPFGYFQIDDLEAGQVYVVSVTARRFSFSPIVVNMSDNISGLDLTMY